MRFFSFVPGSRLSHGWTSRKQHAMIALLILLIARVQSALAGVGQGSSCFEPRTQFEAAVALVSSLETQLEEARQNVIAKELQVNICESGPNLASLDSSQSRRTTDHSDVSCMWQAHNAVVTCSTFGGKSNAIEVADAGAWTHAHREISVEPDARYTLRGEFFPLAHGECDGSAVVKWCSPSVVVCPGPYNGDYYNTGGCLVGLAPVGKDAWEPFKATFTATGVSTVTVYINQESTTYSSVVADVTVQQLITQPTVEAAAATQQITRNGGLASLVADHPPLHRTLLQTPPAGAAKMALGPCSHWCFAHLPLGARPVRNQQVKRGGQCWTMGLRACGEISTTLATPM
jgi:hypothetical protein